MCEIKDEIDVIFYAQTKVYELAKLYNVEEPHVMIDSKMSYVRGYYLPKSRKIVLTKDWIDILLTKYPCHERTIELVQTLAHEFFHHLEEVKGLPYRNYEVPWEQRPSERDAEEFATDHTIAWKVKCKYDKIPRWGEKFK